MLEPAEYDADDLPELPAAEVFEAIYRRHGHRCPMSTLGGRLGHAARRFMAAKGSRQLMAIYHARTCALDGIAHTTGCDEQQGRLQVRTEGRHLLHLFDRQSGLGVALLLRQRALDIAWEYRRAAEALEHESTGLEADALRQRRLETEHLLDRVLDRLRTLPDSELLELQPLYPCSQGD